MTKNKDLSIGKIAIYCFVFSAVWSARELALRPIIESFNETSEILISTILKLAIWTLPALLLINRFNNDMMIKFKEMFVTKVKWLKYIPLLLVFFLYYAVMAYFSFGKLEIHPNITLSKIIGAVVFVGVTEEIVFRAWLLNAMLNKIKLWLAIIINAVLFVLIHFPIWFYREYDPITILSNSAGILVLSIIFSLSFIRSKNILVPMILHMCWNLFTILFFGSGV